MDILTFEGEGWPLVQEALKFIEAAYQEPFKAVAKSLGEGYLIISGVEDQGNGTVNAGYVLIDGEIMPFLAGSIGANVVIVQETVEANYDNNGDGNFVNQAPVWKKRYAKFGLAGTGEETVAFSNFERLDTQQQIMNKTKFVKKGSVQLTNFNYLPEETPPPPSYVTGDYTGISEIDNGAEQLYQVKIEFAEIEGDYFPLIISRSTADFFTNDYLFHEIFLVEKASTYIILNVKSNYTQGEIFLNKKIDLYLLK